MTKLLSLIGLFALVLAGCGSAAKVSLTGTPTTRATAEATRPPSPPANPGGAPTSESSPAATVTPVPNVYSNDALGFRLILPDQLEDARSARCRPDASAGNDQVMLGTNISIRVQPAAGRQAADAANEFLATINARADTTANVTVDGMPGVRIEYRLQPGARFGIATFAVRSSRLYTLVFEARDPAQCGGFATPALYDAVVAGLRFAP